MKYKNVLLAGALSLLSVIPAAATAETPPPVTDILVDTNTTWTGDFVEYLKTKNPKVRIQTTEFAPGASTGWHLHETPLYVYVLSGTFEVDTFDGRMQQWSAGQAFVEIVNIAHEGWNPGTEPAKLLIVFTGEEGTPFMTAYPPMAYDKKLLK